MLSRALGSACVDMDEDLTMLIGPAQDGSCAGSSTSSSTRANDMKHTEAEIEDAARRFERLAGRLDPAATVADDLSDLRAIAEAVDRVRRAEALMTEKVAAARARGRSWNRV